VLEGDFKIWLLQAPIFEIAAELIQFFVVVAAICGARILLSPHRGQSAMSA
jgi:hypothetical protein